MKESVEQLSKLATFRECWFFATIAHGSDHAIALIEKYMRGESLTLP